MTVLTFLSFLYYLSLVCQSFKERFSRKNGLQNTVLGTPRRLFSRFAGAKVRRLFHSCKSFANFFGKIFHRIDMYQRLRARTLNKY